MTQPNTKSPPFWTITLSIINIAIVAYVLVEHHQTKYALLNTLSQAQSLSQTQETRHQQEIAQLKKTFQTTIRQAQIPAELHLDVWQQCHMAMRMSYYHLVFLQQSQQAIQWLQTAQDTLAQNPDSTTKQISQKIQKLIQTLTKTTQPSQDYLLDQISNIQKHILKLEPSFIPQKAKQLAQCNPPPLGKIGYLYNLGTNTPNNKSPTPMRHFGMAYIYNNMMICHYRS